MRAIATRILATLSCKAWFTYEDAGPPADDRHEGVDRYGGAHTPVPNIINFIKDGKEILFSKRSFSVSWFVCK